MNINRAGIAQVLGLDLRSLALFRILIAVVILLDILFRMQFLSEHYLDEGILPRHLLNLDSYRWAPHLQLFTFTDSQSLLLIGFVLLGFFAVLMLLGRATTVATVVCWLLLSALHVRNPYILQSGDALLRVMLFWSIFLPLDQYFVLGRKTSSHQDQPTTVYSCASIAVYLQFIMLYYISALFKLREEKWWDGSYVENSLYRIDYVNHFGIYLSQFPELLQRLTYGSILLELIGPFLLFVPYAFGAFRTLVVFIFISFQIGLALSLYLGLFPLISICTTIPFLPAWFWNRSKPKSLTFLPKPSVFPQLVIAVLILLCVTHNYATYYQYQQMQQITKSALSIFGLNQKWHMFDMAAYTTGIVVPKATLKNGSEIDLITRQKFTTKLPSTLSGYYDSYRIRKYHRELSKDQNNNLRRAYLKHLKRKYEADTSFNSIREISLLWVGYSIIPTPKRNTLIIKELDRWRID